MLNRAEMKAIAKEAMSGRKPKVYFVAIFFLVISNILSELSMRIQLGDTDIDVLVNDMLQGASFVPPELSIWGSLILLAVAVMSSVLTVGFQNYCLKVSRSEKAGIGEIFDVFSIFFKVFGLIFMTGLFIILWSFLFIIPGIIAGLRYSMAVYILLDDPSKGIMQCIRESKEMTYGHKWELFVLDLSFIGWYFLAGIPSGFAAMSPLIAAIGTILINAFVTPYVQTTLAVYYNKLSGWKKEADVIIE